MTAWTHDRATIGVGSSVIEGDGAILAVFFNVVKVMNKGKLLSRDEIRMALNRFNKPAS